VDKAVDKPLGGGVSIYGIWLDCVENQQKQKTEQA
jgi:hypothetical protein